MPFVDTERRKRTQLSFIHETIMAWIGFYKQNNKFGNYNSIISSLVEEEKVLKSKRFQSRILED